ncbi:MAG: MFS transporter [Candidatus Helarchaeota archaeon]|nr:MFS transporter [Candidatus Helarchaeota archaeon]
MEKKEKIIYGSGRFGSSLLLDLVSFLTFYLYFEIFNLAPILSGIATGLGKFTIAFSGFFFGYISDKTNTKFGRRKPYILIGAPALAISFILLFIPHIFGLNLIKILGISIGNEIRLFIYLLIFVCTFNFFYGFLLSPYQAWMRELTLESERIEVSAYQNFFNVLAVGVSAIFAFSFPEALTGEGMSILPIIVIIFGLIEICGYVTPLIKLKEDLSVKIERNLIEGLKVTWRNKNFMTWQLAQGCFAIVFTIVINSALGFMENVLLFGMIQYIIAALILFIAVIILWTIWGYLSKKKSKHYALQSALIIFTIFIPFSLVIGIVKIEILGFIYIGLIAAGISSWYLFPYVVMADFAEEDELITGDLHKAGLYWGVKELYLNIFQAPAMILSGLIFGLLPYLPITFTESNRITWIIILGIQDLPGSNQIIVWLGLLLGKFPFSFDPIPKLVSSGYLWFGPITVIFMVLGLLVFRNVKIDFNLEERRKEINE